MTSLIIPCVAKHMSLLPTLARHIKNQTTQPNEIIICVSDCHEKITNIAQQVEKIVCPTPIKWSITSKQKYIHRD